MNRCMNAIVVLLATFAGTWPDAIQAQEKAKPGTRYAILVGIELYQKQDQLSPLKYCAEDVDLVRETLLLECGYDEGNIVVMKEADKINLKPMFRPYRGPLMDRLREVLKKTVAEDSVLFFFSGHGLLDENTGLGYLATVDTNTNQLPTTALAMSELRRMLTDPDICQAQSKLVILDCCHAGAKGATAAVKGAAAPGEVGRALQGAKGLFTLGSCTSKQISLEFDDKKHGLFTYYLIEGLKGVSLNKAPADTNRDGLVTDHELYTYTGTHVAKKAIDMGGQQNPVHINDGDTTGLFTVAGFATKANGPDETRVASVPLARAYDAYRLLKLNLSAKGIGDRMEAANTLTEVTEGLRSPFQGEIRVRVDNPFKQPASQIADWLELAEAEYQKNKKPVPKSLKISYMLAAWYSDDAQDLSVATRLADDLAEDSATFDFAGNDQAVRLQSMLIYAQTRGPDPAEQAKAARMFGRIVTEIDARKYSSEAPLEATPEELASQVLTPALAKLRTIDEKHPSYQALRAELAKVYYSHGHLISDRSDLRANDQLAAIDAFREASKLDSESALYSLAIAAELLEREDPSLFPEIRQHVAEAQARSQRQSVTYIGSRRISGGVLLRESRNMSRVQRVETLRKAIDEYNHAIKDYQQASPDVQARAKKHFIGALAGRGTANVEIANLTPPEDPQHNVLLLAARTDAEKLLTLNYRNCWMLAGNVYEDLKDYDKAQDAFLRSADMAIHDVDLQMRSYVCLGRAQFKAGQFAESVQSLNYALEMKPSAEPNYFLGLIHKAKSNLDQADEHFQAAWDITKFELNETNYNRLVYCNEYALLPLSQAVAALGNTDESETAAVNLLSRAQSRARELAPYSLWKSKKIICWANLRRADVFLSRSRRLGADPNALEVAKKALDTAKAEYESLLRDEQRHMADGTFDQDNRYDLRCDYCELLMSGTRRSVYRFDTDAIKLAAKTADEAVQLASTDGEKAYALGCAGNARILLRDNPGAEAKLRESVALDPNQASAWLWNYCLSQLVRDRAVVQYNTWLREQNPTRKAAMATEGLTLIKDCRGYIEAAGRSPQLVEAQKQKLTQLQADLGKLRFRP